MTAADESLPAVAILGASGLIGHAMAMQLQREGFPVRAIARRFTAAQAAALGDATVAAPLVGLGPDALATVIDEADVVVNCLGVLQDSARGRADEVHQGFVAHLVEAQARRSPSLLVHVSIPGRDEDDHTAFSVTKRQAEHTIVAATAPFVILRPGFVLAPTAYGGSALLRALAMLPFDLPPREAGRPFATTDAADIAATVAAVARRWHRGERQWHAVWDVMAPGPTTAGDVLQSLRRYLGGPAAPRLAMPSRLMDLAAKTGDLAARLGWVPPIRSTPLQEMRRGVEGDPAPWIAETGIEPTSLEATLRRVPATVQDRWFARLYLLKPLIVATLAVFWVVSGLIALTVAFGAATAILTSHGFPPPLAIAVTVGSSLIDIAVGVGIAVRRTCRAALVAGIGVSLFYMAGAALIAPEMWIEPLGALVKTGPAIVLMLVALAVLEDR